MAAVMNVVAALQREKHRNVSAAPIANRNGANGLEKDFEALPLQVDQIGYIEAFDQIDHPLIIVELRRALKQNGFAIPPFGKAADAWPHIANCEHLPPTL